MKSKKKEIWIELKDFTVNDPPLEKIKLSILSCSTIESELNMILEEQKPEQDHEIIIKFIYGNIFELELGEMRLKDPFLKSKLFKHDINIKAKLGKIK